MRARAVKVSVKRQGISSCGRNRVLVVGDCEGSNMKQFWSTPAYAEDSVNDRMEREQRKNRVRRRVDFRSEVVKKSSSEQLPVAKGTTTFEDLSEDTVVEIVCKLDHTDLKPVRGICKKFRSAVSIAQKHHFAFKTPTKVRKMRFAFPADESMAEPNNEEASEFKTCSPDMVVTPAAPMKNAGYDLTRKIIDFDGIRTNLAFEDSEDEDVNDKPHKYSRIGLNRVLF